MRFFIFYYFYLELVKLVKLYINYTFIFNDRWLKIQCLDGIQMVTNVRANNVMMLVYNLYYTDRCD